MAHRVKAQRHAFILAMQMGLIGQIDLGYVRREERRTRFSQELGFHEDKGKNYSAMKNV